MKGGGGNLEDFESWMKQVHGYDRMRSFSVNMMWQQVRAATCAAQADVIGNIVRTGVIPKLNDPTQHPYGYLDNNTPLDTLNDVRWARIVTSRNDRRIRLNFRRAVSWCRAKGVPLVMWPKCVTTNNRPNDYYQHLKDPSSVFYEHFAPGAPAMLTTNVVPHLAVSNGTSATMHSLTWETEEQSVRMRNRIAHARPGQIIVVEAPAFVNVVIESTNALPLQPVHSGDPIRRKYVLPVPWGDLKRRKYAGVQMPPLQQHMVELAFALTFFKVQGATLDALILDLNFATQQECTSEALYVGLSRVRRARDLLLVPISDRLLSKTQWLSDLKWNADLDLWMNAMIARFPPDRGQSTRVRAAIANAVYEAVAGAAAAAAETSAGRAQAAAAAAAVATDAAPRYGVDEDDAHYDPFCEGAGAGAGAGAGWGSGAGAGDDSGAGAGAGWGAGAGAGAGD